MAWFGLELVLEPVWCVCVSVSVCGDKCVSVWRCFWGGGVGSFTYFPVRSHRANRPNHSRLKFVAIHTDRHPIIPPVFERIVAVIPVWCVDLVGFDLVRFDIVVDLVESYL